MTHSRVIPVILLIVSLAGLITLSDRLGVADTIAMLICGATAGASLAALAGGRRRSS